MRLRDPAGQDLVTRTIRTREGYLVPRGEGRYVLGATVEERGWDTAPTTGATFELIRDLAEVVPGVLELEIEELGAGLRPGTPDNLPVIGPAAGLVWATGHYRNGILLAPTSPPRRSPPCSPATACPSGRRRAIRRGFAEVSRMRVLVNGEPTELETGATVQSVLAALELPGGERGVAVAVDAEVVPRGRMARARVERGRAGRDPARDPGRLRWLVTETRDTFTIGGRELTSRLLLGTGGFRSLEAMAAAIEASGAELVTVALRRIDPGARGSLVDVLDARRRAAAAQHRRLLHGPRRRPDRAARPRGVRDRLGQARGDRRRAHAAARRARAARGRRGARRRRLHRAARTRTTTRCSRAGWRTSAAPR